MKKVLLYLGFGAATLLPARRVIAADDFVQVSHKIGATVGYAHDTRYDYGRGAAATLDWNMELSVQKAPAFFINLGLLTSLGRSDLSQNIRKDDLISRGIINNKTVRIIPMFGIRYNKVFLSVGTVLGYRYGRFEENSSFIDNLGKDKHILIHDSYHHNIDVGFGAEIGFVGPERMEFFMRVESASSEISDGGIPSRFVDGKNTFSTMLGARLNITR